VDVFQVGRDWLSLYYLFFFGNIGLLSVKLAGVQSVGLCQTAEHITLLILQQRINPTMRHGPLNQDRHSKLRLQHSRAAQSPETRREIQLSSATTRCQLALSAEVGAGPRRLLQAQFPGHNRVSRRSAIRVCPGTGLVFGIRSGVQCIAASVERLRVWIDRYRTLHVHR